MAVSSLASAASSQLASISSSTSQLSRRVLKLPQVYQSYVASNPSSVSSVESTLRSLTYLVPGARFQDSEIASESLHTFIQLLSIYHDFLLKKRTDLVSSSPSLSKIVKTAKPTQHARYTTFWSDSGTLYTKIATALKVAQYTGLLWEMFARRRGGEQSRWRIVVLLESFKALCRLILLRITKGKPTVSPPQPLREDFAPQISEPFEEHPDDELARLEEQEMKHIDPMPMSSDPREPFLSGPDNGIPTPPLSESDKIPFASTPPNPHLPYTLRRTNLTLPVLPSPADLQAYLQSHLLTTDDAKSPQSLLHTLSSHAGLAGELLYILRPVIYALLMQHYARRSSYIPVHSLDGRTYKHCWTPWLAGFAIELLSRHLVTKDLYTNTPGGKAGLSKLEREQMEKRGWDMMWWGMRGAFYENVTKGIVNGVVGKMKGVPLLDMVGGVLEDYEGLWGRYWGVTETM